MYNSTCKVTTSAFCWTYNRDCLIENVQHLHDQWAAAILFYVNKKTARPYDSVRFLIFSNWLLFIYMLQ